jgi:thiol-disulfide isomerase/thioredoxin
MFNRTNVLIVVIAIAGAVAGFLAGGWLRPLPISSSPQPALKVGDPAPAVRRPDVRGAPRTLDEWRGKLVLVNFWASWCEPCREEMPLLARTQQRLAAKGLQIVGIANDSADATRAFLAHTPVDYPILIDDPAAGEDLPEAFGDAQGVLPFTVLIGRDGRVLAHRAGRFTQASLDSWLAPHL